MFQKILLSSLIIAVCFSACQKEYNPFEETNPAGVGSFQAKVNGTLFTANVTSASIQAGVIVVFGSSSGKSILLRVADSGVRNYQFVNTSFTNVAAYQDSSLPTAIGQAAFTTNGWEVDGNYGNMNVTKIDTAKKTISGTFALRVYRNFDSLTRTITEGIFTDIPYASAPPPLTGNDSFRVKLDGTEFIYSLRIGMKALGKLSITAGTASGYPTIGLYLPDTINPGVYPFAGFDYLGQYNKSATELFASDTGRVTIISHDKINKRIRGSFNFLANTPFTNLPPNFQLTDGYFNMGYQ